MDPDRQRRIDEKTEHWTLYFAELANWVFDAIFASVTVWLGHRIGVWPRPTAIELMVLIGVYMLLQSGFRTREGIRRLEERDGTK